MTIPANRAASTCWSCSWYEAKSESAIALEEVLSSLSLRGVFQSFLLEEVDLPENIVSISLNIGNTYVKITWTYMAIYIFIKV